MEGSILHLCRLVKPYFVNMQTFSQIVELIKKLKGWSKDKEVAELFGYANPRSLGSAKTRNNIPFERLIEICEAEGVDLSMIFLGHPIEWQENYSKDEIDYIDKLIEILRGKNIDNAEAIKSNINAFWKSRNMETEPLREEKTAQAPEKIPSKKRRAGL